MTLIGTGCEKKSDPAAEAPQQSQVLQAPNPTLVSVDHPEQFPVATAKAYQATSSLHVTGVVNPDISRQIPVISLASGRIIAILARVGDFVQKGHIYRSISELAYGGNIQLEGSPCSVRGGAGNSCPVSSIDLVGDACGRIGYCSRGQWRVV